MTTMVLDGERYGYGSNEWLIKAAVDHAPVENKDLMIKSLIHYLAGLDQNLFIRELLDIIAQGVLTGNYTPTLTRADLAPEVPETDYREEGNEARIAEMPPLTDEEITETMKELWNAPDAHDPLDKDN